MDFLKYYKNEKNIGDCWEFVQLIFKDEHNFILPDHPILIDKKEIATALISNIPYKIVNKAEKGCIIYYFHDKIHHAGYALDDKRFIHKTTTKIDVSKIPQNAIIYKVLND